MELQEGTIDTVMSELNFASGMHVGRDEDVLFVSRLAGGEILRIK